MGHALVFMISEVKTTTKLSEAACDGVTTGYLSSFSEFEYCTCGTEATATATASGGKPALVVRVVKIIRAASNTKIYSNNIATYELT